ncbi:MAG: hypothetical protein SGPRY_009571 [Prymnesium sp.]
MSWEELSRLVDEKGALVRELKQAGDKQALDDALAALLKLKEELRAALEAAIEAEPDAAKREELSAKLPPVPKSKADKKKEAKDTGAAAANKKAAEEAKAAARAKKKAAEAEKKPPIASSSPSSAPAPPPAPAPSAAPKEPNASASPQRPGGAAVTNDPIPASKAKPRNKGYEVLFLKEQPPVLALLAARVGKLEVLMRRVEAKQMPEASGAMLLLPLGSGSLLGEAAIARHLARVAPAPALLYGTPGDITSASEVDQWLEYAPKL